MAPDDPASVTLAAIRERNEQYITALALTEHTAAGLPCGDVRLLLKAVEAVLAPHQPGRRVVFGSTCERHEAHRHFSITATEADDVRACPDCTATVYTSCAGCGVGMSVDECPVREAITSALAGKEAGDGNAE